MITYYALIAQGATGKVCDIEPLISVDYEAAKKEAARLAQTAHSHDILHVCTIDEDGQHHSVAARMVCRDVWIDSYPIQ